MKKYLIIAGILVALPSLAFVGRFGGSYSTSDPEQIFIRVKNSESSTAIAAGDVLCGDTSADDGVSVKLCVGSTDAGRIPQCIGSVAISAGKFGLCQVYGYHSAIKVSAGVNNITAGGRLVAGSDGSVSGKADGKSTGDAFGWALDAASSTTTIKGFVKLL